MNKRKLISALTVAALLLLSYFVYSRYIGSTLSENGRIDSEILKEIVSFSVYLPPGYHTSSNKNRRYPVLYLFHGASGDHTIYPRKIGIKRIADQAIGRGECVPMVIVMPQSRGGVNANLGDRYRYEDFFFRELVPKIEETYRVRTEREYRAVAGHSMGGHGALLYGLKHPDKFSACCAIGAAFELTETEPEGTPHPNDLDMLLQKTAETDSRVRFYIDCGKNDGLISVNERLHARMTELGISHEFHVGNGGHTWEYWRQAMPGVLRFVGNTPDRF